MDKKIVIDLKILLTLLGMGFLAFLFRDSFVTEEQFNCEEYERAKATPKFSCCCYTDEGYLNMNADDGDCPNAICSWLKVPCPSFYYATGKDR